MRALSLNRPGCFACVVSALTLLAAPTFAAAPPPIVRDIELTAVEDTEAQGQVAANVRPGETLTVKLKRPAKHGEVQLDAVTGAFTYRPAPDYTGDDGFAVDVSNGKRSATAKVTVHVDAVNDAPQAQPLTLSTSEDAPTKSTVAAKDIDRDILTYRVSAAPAHGDASVDPRTGAVAYRPTQDFNGSDTFTVEVSDGALTATSEVAVTIVPINDAPVVRASPQPCTEDTACEGHVQATDVDADTLTYRVTAKPKHGELTLDAATGAFSFAPAKDFHGDDAFGVEVSDGKLKAAATYAVRVAAMNDAPVAQPLTLTTIEDAPATGTVVAADVDQDVLAFRVTTPAAHGDARIDARSGAVSYRPTQDYNGTDTFTVEVSDGQAPVTVEVPVTLSAVNDAPLAKAGAHAVDEDGRLQAACVATDVDADPLTFKLGTLPKHGTLETDAAGAFTYVPARDYHGPDSFTFQVSDGKLKSEAVVRLTVRAVNDAPVSAAMSLTSNEDEPTYGAVVATDVDADALAYTIDQAPAHGEAKVDPRTGAVTYAPAADYHGPDAFTVAVSDGALTATTAVTVALTAVDDAPRVRPQTLAATEDTRLDAQLPGADVDADAVTFHILSQPALGFAELLDSARGTWRFVPKADLNGDAELTFDISDGRSTVTGTVKVHVAAVNDVPVAKGLQLATREDEAVEGRVEASDVDADRLTYAIKTQPASGRATVDAATGRVRFEPAKDQYGPVSFTVTASDAALTSAPAVVSLSVDPVNDAPVAKSGTLSVDEDTVQNGAFVASDVDGDALTYTMQRAPQHGAVVITGAKYVYTPAPNYFGADAFAFTASDPSGAQSTAEVKVTVVAVNDPPVAQTENITGPCHGSVTGRLHGFDRESRTVTYRIAEKPKHGTVKLIDEKTGDFVFYSDGADDAADGFVFTVFDGEAESAPAEMTVHMQTSCRTRG